MAHFRVPQRSIVVLRECVLEATLPAGHPARFIWSALERLDFAAIEAQYTSVTKCTGRPPYHPRVLAALWIYGMTRGFGTASEIAEACLIRDDFRWLAGGLSPCDQTLLNFLTIGREHLPGLWEQVLKAMQAAGCIDLSALAEDGTKLRANASRRSFHSAAEIATVIDKLKAELAREIEKVVPPEASKEHQARVGGLKGRLERAIQAAAEVQRRKERREGGAQEQPPPDAADADSPSPDGSRPRHRVDAKFPPSDFTLDPERDVVLCPAKQELRFVGVYPTDNGTGSYRLYKRLDCTNCPLKSHCTDARGRRVKFLVPSELNLGPPGETEAPISTEPNGPTDQDVPTTSQPEDRAELSNPGPQGSLTDPEAVMMLATSEKRFEPSYNADITLTRHEIIVSEFLTKVPVDFPHFRRALPNVISTVGHPATWAGDGHYATQANLVLAEREAVILYAPTQEHAQNSKDSFTAKDFDWDSQRDIVTCPAGCDLEKIGTYGYDQERPYDLYVQRDCRGCELKPKCTTARGRRFKRYHQHALVEALEARMAQDGEKMRKFRSSTVEPVHGQLKQHGLERFHVRGLARCGTVLTLACIAHNLMKWRGMEAAGVTQAAA